MYVFVDGRSYSIEAVKGLTKSEVEKLLHRLNPVHLKRVVAALEKGNHLKKEDQKTTEKKETKKKVKKDKEGGE